MRPFEFSVTRKTAAIKQNILKVTVNKKDAAGIRQHLKTIVA